MSKFISQFAAMALMAGSLSTTVDQAEARIEAGMLTCEVGKGFALIFSSPRELHCVFHKPNGQTEAYEGRLREFGLDVGVSGRGVIAWEVIASTTEIPPGELAGHYGGVEAGAAAVVGGSGRILVGGANRTVSLQPLSVEGRAGINLAVGVASMELHPLFRVSHRTTRVTLPAVGLRHDVVPHHQKTPHYSCGSYTHLMRGQTLYGVAHACGVTLEALLDANPEITNVRDISAGELIHIPTHLGHHAGSPCGDRAVLNEGEGLDHLAWRCRVTLHALLQANPHVRDTGMIQAGLVMAIPERIEAPRQPPVQYARTETDLTDTEDAAEIRPIARQERRQLRQPVAADPDRTNARRLVRLEIACEDETAGKYGLNPRDVTAQSIERGGRGSFTVHLNANGGDAVCLISRNGDVQFVAYESEFAPVAQSSAAAGRGARETGQLASASDSIRRETVRFARGANSGTVEGSIRGREIVDYRLNVRAGQYLNVSMATDNTANYFNLMEPGETEVAIFNGSINGNQFEGTANRSGDYTIRVYLMRSAARRNETANYRLEMIAGDGAGQGAGQAASTGSGSGDVTNNACLDAVARETRDRNVVVLSSEYSEANSLVMVGVGAQRAPWRCLVSNDGQVAEISFEGNDNAGVPGSQAMAGANVLADSEWRPMTIGGGGVPDGANPVIRFQDDGTVAGDTGCNRFTGSYSISGDRIDIGPLATTKMACPDMAMNLEDRILASLDRASTFVRDRANLALRDDAGSVVATLIGSGSGSSEPSGSPSGAEAIPNYERPVGGVMPKGSSFSATGQIKCVRDRDAADAMCDFGVVREGNGNGWVMVFWPDGGNRAIFFENGTPIRYDESEADGGAKMTVTRDGDTSVVFVGEARFEIPDAAIFGG